MQQPTSERFSPAFTETLVVAAATLAALALLGAVLAYWTWALIAPRPEPRVAAAAAMPGIESARTLFGAAPRAGSATGTALTLLGVAAATGKRPGHAIIQTDGRRTVVVREGEEIASGLRLAEVHGNHVVLDRAGARETLAWPRQNRAVR